jgi:hypothetical protein
MPQGDDWTYLVTFAFRMRSRANHTWVLDREQELVTFLRCSWEKTLMAFLIDSHFGFGYIKIEGKGIPISGRLALPTT